MLQIIYRLYQYFSNALYLYFFFDMMAQLFPLKKRANIFTYYVCPIVVFWLAYYFPQYGLGHATIPYFYYFICVLTVSLITIMLMLSGSAIQKLIYYMYYFTVYKCAVFILGAFVYELETVIDHNIYIFIDMFSCSVVIAILLFFKRFCLRHPMLLIQKMHRNDIILMMVCPISFFTILQLGDPSINFSHAYFVSIAALLLLVNLPIIYYLYIRIGENYDARAALGKAVAETKIQLTRYRYSILIEEQARKERHELKNKYFYIQTLLNDNKLEQLSDFLAEHIGELSDDPVGIRTDNILIDHILNTKLNLAKKHHIKTYTEVLIPAELSINEQDFCTILLNLLDNAIEASQKEASPDIQIYLNIRNNYLVCSIKNKVSTDVLANNPKLRTSKSDSKSHGHGVKIVKETVKRSNGIFDTYMEAGYFVATVMIPLA